jgi:hypothetical protein
MGKLFHSIQDPGSLASLMFERHSLGSRTQWRLTSPKTFDSPLGELRMINIALAQEEGVAGA